MSEKTFNDVKITSSFTMPETREKLVSGETIGQHFGKIAKVIDDLENGKIVCPDEYTETGNPLVMDGLQGGVPFPEITVTGDIAGKELTMVACGKNLISTEYIPLNSNVVSTIDDNGIVTVTTTNPFAGNAYAVHTNNTTAIPIDILNNECTIGITWIDGLWCDSDADAKWLGVQVIFYDYNAKVIPNTVKYMYITNGKKGLNKIASISRKTIDIPETAAYFVLNFWISGNAYLTNFKYALQLELGGAATEYEPYSGAEYKITPDSNPYTVPADIRQQNGRNTLYISDESNPQLTVTGAYKNGTTEKIWEELTKKADLTHTHTKSQITDFPTSLPADGGNSDTVNNHTIESDVPKNAKFTDTVITVDTELSSTSVNPVQNKVVKNELDNKANKSDIPTSLPANGGNAENALAVRSSNLKACLWEDSEGGNLRLTSPNGKNLMEMDLYNDDTFRMFFSDENEVSFPFTYNFSTKKLSLNGDITNADTLDGYHAADIMSAVSSGGYVSGSVSCPEVDSSTQAIVNVTLGFKPSAIIAMINPYKATSTTDFRTTSAIILDDNKTAIYSFHDTTNITKTTTGLTVDFGVSGLHQAPIINYIAFK